MPRNRKYINFIESDLGKIKEIIFQVSKSAYDYIESNRTSSFHLFYKNITHSDLPTFGKATHVNQLENNLLYYISKSDMEYIEHMTKKPFETAHQSCIGLMKEWYDIIETPNPRDEKYLLNDYMNVYVVNECSQYFASRYTEKIFNKLNKTAHLSRTKKREWNFDSINLLLADKWITPINLHVAVHGLGVRQDIEFHKLRHHIFKGDSFILLYEHKQNGTKNLFILLSKNPLFFNILGETNPLLSWTEQAGLDALSKNLKETIESYLNEDKASRSPQNVWKNMLADEMMAYTQKPNHIFCPFTYIDVDYDKLKTLFRASHIKGFSDPTIKPNEVWDVNNGLLLTANADALFDKHLITINNKKELVFSKTLKADENFKNLIEELHLNNQIFLPILNDKRMEYLRHHYNVFVEKEKERSIII